jgi:3-oxoacyl-[acyl-carrier protein] reductase
MGLLDAKVAVVTGAAQGIGLELARVLASEGASVVIADVNLEGVVRAATQLAAKGTTATPVQCDVTSESDVTSLIANAVSQLGRVDIMVNNAGITRDATLRKMSLADFRSAAAAMREQEMGSIINMSSISGKVGNIGQTNYSAAKAGIVGLTKAAAKELAHVGVRVNAIQPGLIRTSMTEAMRPEIWDQKLKEIPLGRAGEPTDVANAALFLASDLSSYVTGAVLEVAGGRYM